MRDEVDAPTVSEILLLVQKKREKIGVQRKTTTLAVVCDRHSPKPEDYILSTFKKWHPRNSPLHLKVNSRPH